MIKIKIRLIALFCSVTIICVIITSCNSNNPNNNSDNYKMFSFEYVAPISEQLEFVDVKILLPLYYEHENSKEEIQESMSFLSSLTEKSLNCTVTMELADYGGYASHLEKAVAAGEIYDIVFLKQGRSDENSINYSFDKEFWYKPWVDKELIKDITDDVQKYFPKGIIYNEMISGAKSPDGKVFAIPKVNKVMLAYGALCTNKVLDNYGKNTISGYNDFIKLIDSNLKEGLHLSINLQLIQLLNMYLHEISMLSISSTNILYDRITNKLSYLENTEIPDIVFNQYKKYYDMGIIGYKSSYWSSDVDIHVTDYMSFKYSNGFNPLLNTVRDAKNHSLLLIGGESNDLYWYYSLSAVAIFINSQQTERALMVLALLNSGNYEYTDILQFGIKDKHYKKTIDDKIEIINRYSKDLLFWGEYLLNFDSEAARPFSFEVNSNAWQYCMLNDNKKEIIHGITNEDLMLISRNMPGKLVSLASKRMLPTYNDIPAYFNNDESVDELIKKLQTNQNEELFNWLENYLTPKLE